MKLLRWLGFALLLVLPLIALYYIFMLVPNERTMGEVQRIFYFHVASAWVAASTESRLERSLDTATAEPGLSSGFLLMSCTISRLSPSGRSGLWFFGGSTAASRCWVSTATAVNPG